MMVKRKYGLGVGDVAARAGIAVSAIHFYERKGLITSERDQANHRRFAPSVLRKLSIIQVAQRAGIPLSEISKNLEFMPRDAKINLRHWKKLSTGWRDDLQDRIDRLERLKNGLDECIGCGCLSIKTCQLVNKDDHIGKNGSGPRFLEEDAPSFN